MPTQMNSHMSAIQAAIPLRYEFLREQLCRYVLEKFELANTKCPENTNFDAHTETGLLKNTEISVPLMTDFDIEQLCNEAVSSVEQRTQLFMDIQQSLDIELPALDSGRVKNMDSLSRIVWNTLAREDAWHSKMDL